MTSDPLAESKDHLALEPSNRVLASLPGSDLLSLQPQLEAVPLASGSVLFDVDEALQRVYFIEAGVVSVVAAHDRRVTIGVATVGCEGVVGGAPLILGGDTAFSRSRVLVPGSAQTMRVSLFRDALRQIPLLRAACEAHTRGLFVQMLQAVPCSRLHTAQQRCARWLLMCGDQAESDTFELTEHGLAELLGVSRSKLTGLAGKLQAAGLICYRDGAVSLLDRPRLETAACECYRITRNRNARPLERTSEAMRH
jgi:CRP-like cAMP-binding protein